MKLSLSNQIFLAIICGVALGAFAPGVVPYISWVGDVFVLALKMLIAPLILASIVMGMAALGDVRQLGALGGKTVAYYVSTTVLAVILGLVVVNVVNPGRSSRLDPQDAIAVEAFALPGLPEGRGLAVELERQGWTPEAAQEAAIAFNERAKASPPNDPAAISQIATSVVAASKLRARISAQRGKAAADDASKLQSAKLRNMTVPAFLKAQLKKLLQNPFKALADMNVLGIIVFALLLGGILTTLGERGKPLTAVFDGLNQAMMKLVDLVMLIAPPGVLALLADQIASSGLGILKVLAWYMFAVLLGLGVHAVVVLPAILKVVGKVSPLAFASRMREALAVAFSTCSSAATMPVTMECLDDKAGVPPRITGFVIPLGATINMDGTALYEAVAALFIAQVYGIELGPAQQILVALTATLAAIGAAGIPSAGTVTMVMVLSAVGLPVEGIGLILAVDRLLDMFRTTTNVWGDAIGAAVVAQLEGEPATMSGPDAAPVPA